MISLGIDLGTTSIKVCIVKEKEILVEKILRHRADIPGQLGVQDAQVIIESCLQLIENVLKKFDIEFPSEKVNRVRIAGQMHGVVLWNSQKLMSGELDSSPLYTWMYSNSSLPSLPLSSRPIFPGFGGLTLFEIDYGNWDSCGTVMDLFACFICRLKDVNISWQLAESFGYCSDGKWDESLKEQVKEKIRLPEIVDDDQFILGKVKRIKELEGTDVLIPLGDLQASIKSIADDRQNIAYLILGTSSQLCVLTRKGLKVPCSTVDILSYSSYSCDLLAGRSMNGGNAVDSFLKILLDWTRKSTGENIPSPNIERLLMEVDEMSSTNITVVPTFIQERGLPPTGGSISGIDNNTCIVEVLSAICNGIVDNLINLFPLHLIKSLGVRQLYLVGNAKKLRFSRRIRYLCEKEDIEVIESSNEISAAYGAAIF